MHQNERVAYLAELHQVINSGSPWFFRDFLARWSGILGPLGRAASARNDDELKELLEDVERAMQAKSDHQLAAQLTAPWSVARGF